MIAALYVSKNGPYFGMEGIDPWDEERDAKNYRGPYPVIAHPPCARWCRLAGFVESRTGKKRREDGGCFESALAAVRKYGGVLEHPAYSDAFRAFNLPTPIPGGWQQGICGGWVAHVEQRHYGHIAKKATWLYAVTDGPLPELEWETAADGEVVSDYVWRTRKTERKDPRPAISKQQAIETPLRFKEVLMSIARSVTNGT